MKRIQGEENIQLRIKSLERSCHILGICNILLAVSGIRFVFYLQNIYGILLTLTDALIIVMKAVEKIYKAVELLHPAAFI